MPESFIKSAGAQFRAKGVDFALAEDAATAVARLATDSSINGKIMGLDLSEHRAEVSMQGER